MFPDPILQRLGAEDRIPVALFYLDEFADQKKPTWKMLFEGEIVSWGYTNSASGRSVAFNCVMNISMYTQLYIFYMTSLSSVATGQIQQAQDASVITESRAVAGGLLFRQGLLSPDRQATSPDNFIKRPFDLAYNVVRAIISDRIPEGQRAIPGINFFQRWIRREQFHNRWVALPFLEEPTLEDGSTVPTQGVFPILRAVQSLEAVRAVENFVEGQSTGGCIYDLLKQVLDTVMMEMVMLPTAPCVRVRTSDGIILGAPIFRDPANALTPEKLAALGSARFTLLETIAAGTHAQFTINADLVSAALKVAGLDISPADVFNEATLTKGINMIDTVEGAVNAGGPKKPMEAVRLGNYFLKPQMLFGLPPNCNVIFPSMTPSISYQESYITQPTRLYVQDSTLLEFNGLATGDPTAKAAFLAGLSRGYPPDIDRAWRERLEKGAGANSGRNVLIYPEEFFKGPVTTRAPAPPWLMFMKTQEQGSGVKPTDSVGQPNSKSTIPDTAASDGPIAGGLVQQDIYSLYNQYEYFRQRFIQRGGAVTLAFNPYIIPGFPTMVFDDFQSRMHVVGYVMNVEHAFSATSVQSSFNFTHGRTLYEFFDLLANEIDTGGATASRKNNVLASGPAETIKEIRDVTQQFDRAEQFYQALLHQRETKPAVFDYRQVIGYTRADGTLEDISIDGITEEGIAAQRSSYASALAILEAAEANTKQKSQLFAAPGTSPGEEEILNALGVAYDQTITAITSTPFSDPIANGITALKQKIATLKPDALHNLSGQREVQPKPAFEPMFSSYDAAMQYVSRPICTLEEYIEFIRGIRDGINDDLAYSDGREVPSARFYTRIRDLTGASPGFKPTDAQRGLGAETPEAVNDTTTPDFPQMRADWQTLLLQYRATIYSTVRVQR
jgi:hypothetical protein